MLILKLYPGQSIWIDKNVEIILLGNTNNHARIGLESHPEIKIRRKKPEDRKISEQDD